MRCCIDETEKKFDLNFAGGNVMLTKDTMSVKVLDFGMAKPLRGELNFNKQGLKNDILSVIRLFCALYIGEDFSDNFQLQKSMKSGNVREVNISISLVSNFSATYLIC